MNRNPAISVLTPVWNGLPYLKECVESVLAQDFQEWELLISDNGSTDGTLLYLDSLTDERIKVFKQEQNLGIIGNVNFLFTKAKALISQILCADDYLTGQTSLTTIMKYWDRAPADVGFVRFNHMETSPCRIMNLQMQMMPAVVSPDMADLWFFVFGNIPGNLSNVSLRTRLVADTGWFNKDFPFAGDFEFWIRAARKVSMGVQKEPVVYVRRHAMVASNYLSLKGELFDQHLAIYEKLIELLSAVRDRDKLITYFNLEICSFHYRNSLQMVLKGRFSYLRKMVLTNSAIGWPKLFQLMACLPFVLFNGHQKMTLHMAKKLVGKELEQPGTGDPILKNKLLTNYKLKKIKYESSNTSRRIWYKNQRRKRRSA